MVGNHEKLRSRIEQSHYPARQLKRDRVWLIPSVQKPRNAIVFVHGFGGYPVSAWSQFDNFLPRTEEASKSDIFFYGYDSWHGELVALAGSCELFFQRLATSPADELSGYTGREEETWDYESILLVGHSLGCVLCRWALVNAIERGAGWVNKCSMIYFAPAHSGATALKLGAAALQGFRVLWAMAQYSLYKSPLLQQLQPDSLELQFLRERVKTLSSTGRTLFPKEVHIAEHETVVSNLPFPGDPFPWTVTGADHTSICKPTVAFLEPYRAVVRML